jgi:MFS family permease
MFHVGTARVRRSVPDQRGQCTWNGDRRDRQYVLGVGVSGVLMGWLADNQGRRRTLLVSVVLFALFTAGAALARNRWELMALRSVAGVGLGGVWGAVTALVNESWSRGLRGRAISVVLSAWPVGLIGAALLASWVLPNYGWRARDPANASSAVPLIHASRSSCASIAGMRCLAL